MATRRAIRGVLGNLLGTYTSRYSDYDGYWLFGFLVADLVELRIDLLATAVDDSHMPTGVAAQLAVERFDDQMRKAGLKRSQVREACVTIRRLPGMAEGSVNRHSCTGYRVS